MNKAPFGTIALLSALLLTPASLGADKPEKKFQPVDWAGTPVEVFAAKRNRVIGHDDGVPEKDMYQNYREPVVVKTWDGRLVCGVQAGNKHSWPERSGQDFVVSFSDDGGKTWSQPRVATEAGNGSVQSHGLVYDAKKDRLIALYTVFRFDYSQAKGRGQKFVAPLEKAMLDKGEPLQLQFMVSSDDGGETWSVARDITAQMPKHDKYIVRGHFGASEGRQLTLGEHAGRLMLAGGAWLYDDKGGLQGKYIGTWYRDDHAQTWHFSRILETSNTRVYSCESRVTELPDGSLLFNERTRSQGRQQARSTDGGKTWSELAQAPDLKASQCNGSLLTLRDVDGKLTDSVLLSVPSPGGRNNGYLYVSRDGGKTWPTCHDIVGGAFAYSALVQVDAETVGLFWESGHYRNISFTRLRVAKILGE